MLGRLGIVVALSPLALVACSGTVGVTIGASAGSGGAAATTNATTSSSAGGGTAACGEACACPAGASGVQACLADAGGYGLCEGCTATDVPWSKHFGAPGLDGDGRVGAVAADDGVLAVTWVEPNPGPAAQWRLKRFDPTGNAFWDQPIDQLDDVVVDADGSVVIAFDIQGGAPSNILGMPVSCASDACAGLARIGADGTPVWVQTFGANGAKAGLHIDKLQLSASGRIAVGGLFGGTLDLGSGPLSGGWTIFVASLTAGGAPVWGRAIDVYPSTGDFGGWAELEMAVSPAGDVLISGLSDAPIDYGAGIMQITGQTDGFFARYDAAGNVVHGGLIPVDANEVPIGLAFDPAGNAVLAAWASGSFEVGGGPMGTPGQDELTLLRFDPTGKFLGGTPVAQAAGFPSTFPAAVDGAGNTWLCGSFTEPLTVGGATLNPVSQSDLLVLEIDPAGHVAAQRQLGTSGTSYCDRIRLGPTGVPVISGFITGSVDFGQGLLQATGPRDAFIAKLGPSAGP